MADMQNTSSVNPGPLLKGMVKDTDDSYTPEGSWFHLRNGTPYSRDGNLGAISNESSNLLCQVLAYTMHGAIHLYKDVWAIFSTDDVNSEIGIFEEGVCKYTKLKNCDGIDMNVVNCLNFKTSHLIKGVSKENFDCSFSVYFADGLNPDRVINVNKPAFVENCAPDPNNPTCIICTCTDQIDCDLIRLAPLVKTPCFTVSRGPTAGTLQNGSYYVVAAYVLNDQIVTDFYTPSNVQALFEHDNLASALQVDITQMDTQHFDNFVLVVVRTINGQTSAKRFGTYSTRQHTIYIDSINEALASVPIEEIPLRRPNYERSDAIFEVGQYMLRTGPRARFDFNYQPLANRITTKWQAVAYPSDYYAKTGNNTGYLRDEVYPFFIRWLYNTGDKSASYHIPGRPAFRGASANPGPVTPVEASVLGVLFTGDPINIIEPGDLYFETTNTAATTAGSLNNLVPLSILPDGGLVIAEGAMAYWQSTEPYPDKTPIIYDASGLKDPPNPLSNWAELTVPPTYYNQIGVTAIGDYDLCGKPIRHHKFPDTQTIAHFRNKPGVVPPNNPITGVAEPKEMEVVVLGVAFQNIVPPVDNQGVLIPGIVGYEILRGSREGNKTIVAKGIINNMRTYAIKNSSITGLYPNYPYNPLGADSTISTTEVLGQNDATTPATGVSGNQFTFHSPETSFNNPFLSSKELKLYGELYGNVYGNFEESPKHPREKLITDFALGVAALIGTALAASTVRGERVTSQKAPYVSKTGNGLFTAGSGLQGISDVPGTAALAVSTGLAQAAYAGATAADAEGNSLILGNVLATAIGPSDPVQDTMNTTFSTLASSPGNSIINPGLDRQTKTMTHGYIDKSLQAVAGIVLFSNYWTEGTQASLDLIQATIPYTQYALRYISHGFSNQYGTGSSPKTSTVRYSINNSIYVNEGFQQFGQNANAKINNLFRGKTVAIQVDLHAGQTGLQNPNKVTDNTVNSVTTSIFYRPKADPFESDYNYTNVKTSFPTVTTSHYAALRRRIRNQYGQLRGIIQIPVSTCLNNTTGISGSPYTSDTLFNGDIYIGRHTEKNTFFYFWDWLYDQPNGYEYNYQLRYMLNYPAFWANFEKYDVSDFMYKLGPWVTSVFSTSDPFPDALHNLDGDPLNGISSNPLSIFQNFLRLKNKYFYTFQHGVRDFYVESEINVDLRDWEEPAERRHYDPNRFADLPTLFEPKIVKSGNFYRYDQSLSISRVFNNFFPWGNLQEQDYNPEIAETCYTYYPNRMIYSMPQEREGKRDYWRVFLINNYKDFKSKITAVKPINMTGAAIMFQNESPVMFTGQDTLQSDLGVEITVGDGGLFYRQPQAIVNTDTSYEYASCQDRLSVINTKYGLFWMSQAQGKIFNFAGGLNEISLNSMWFWLSSFLPYRLIDDFPNFEKLDNPVAGIGCQTIYDNQEDLLYFCKKDYTVKPQFKAAMTYVPGIGAGTGFFLNTQPVKLGDLTYFDDASWTLSYNPKLKSWIGFHDWHPDLSIPGKNEFLTSVHSPTTSMSSIWRHNARTDSFCNFYGVDYPFEIDRIAQTASMVNTLRSVEYYMEAYIYKGVNGDIYEVLNANFDHATIYNREQVSGTLILNQTPPNNIAGSLLYPKIGPTSIDILADKVEQKYRFNQFWDITADRGEFTFPNVQRPIWNTHVNGYIRDLNPANLNYNKSPFELKKFRHYANHLRLYKNISGNINYVVKLINAKEEVSMR